MPIPEQLSVLVLREGEWWLAIALEYFTTTQAKTLPEALDDLSRMIETERALYHQSGQEPEELRAPEEYWQLFREANAS